MVIFHKAVERCSRSTDRRDTKINPAAIGLDPDRWEKDGLFDDEGPHPERGASGVPGLENMLLDEVVQPV